jgi:hypothetical protein
MERGMNAQQYMLRDVTDWQPVIGRKFCGPQPVKMPSYGRVIALPQVGGLHHRYEHRVA